MQKNQKPPIPKQPDKPKSKEPHIVKGTIEPTEKK